MCHKHIPTDALHKHTRPSIHAPADLLTGGLGVRLVCARSPPLCSHHQGHRRPGLEGPGRDRHSGLVRTGSQQCPTQGSHVEMDSGCHRTLVQNHLLEAGQLQTRAQGCRPRDTVASVLGPSRRPARWLRHGTRGPREPGGPTLAGEGGLGVSVPQHPSDPSPSVLTHDPGSPAPSPTNRG